VPTIWLFDVKIIKLLHGFLDLLLLLGRVLSQVDIDDVGVFKGLSGDVVVR
jgi:hypothetical protein